MKRINKKLLIILVVSIALLIAMLVYRSTYTKKPIWDAVYERSAPVIELKQAANEAQSCKSDEGVDTCDVKRREMLNKFMDASFYNAGYEYCIKKFNKTDEECRKLVDNINTDIELKKIAPSNRDSLTIQNENN